MFIFVKGFQIYETLKFAIIKKLRHFLSEDTFLVIYVVNHYSLGNQSSNPGRDELSAPTAPQHMDQNEYLVPHLEDLKHICLETEARLLAQSKHVIE